MVMTLDSFLHTKFKGKRRRTRAILASCRSERIEVANSVADSLDKIRVNFSSTPYGVYFYNPWKDTIDHVMVESVGSNHWKTYFDGRDCVEVLATDLTYEYLNNNPGFVEIFEGITKDKYPGTTRDNSFLDMLTSCKHQNVSWKDRYESESLSSRFYFPLSLFRMEMLQHFEDMWDPTPDEFLFSIALEGINATSEEERRSIKEAKLLVERQG